METRPFGKTGETFPILSFGGQRIVDTHGCTEEAAIEIVNTAINRGIRYFDTAWMYSDGQAENASARSSNTAGRRCGLPPRHWIPPGMGHGVNWRQVYHGCRRIMWMSGGCTI